MIQLPFAKQRYERWRIPALLFAAIAVLGFAMDLTFGDVSALRTVFYLMLSLPLAFPRNMVYLAVGSVLLTVLGLVLVWGLLLLFSWSSGRMHFTHPGTFFFAGFSILCLVLFAAAALVYHGLNESIPVKEVKHA